MKKLTKDQIELFTNHIELIKGLMKTETPQMQDHYKRLLAEYTYVPIEMATHGKLELIEELIFYRDLDNHDLETLVKRYTSEKRPHRSLREQIQCVFAEGGSSLHTGEPITLYRGMSAKYSDEWEYPEWVQSWTVDPEMAKFFATRWGDGYVVEIECNPEAIICDTRINTEWAYRQESEVMVDVDHLHADYYAMVEQMIDHQKNGVSLPDTIKHYPKH